MVVRSDSRHAVENVHIPQVQPGCSVQVRYDPDDHQNCEIVAPPSAEGVDFDPQGRNGLIVYSRP
jgi:hypothetical protein